MPAPEPIEIQDYPGLRLAALAALKLLRPPPRLSVSEWADQAPRYLSRETSAEPGPWRTDRVPYLRGPMDAFTDPKVERIVLMFAAQLGKSSGLIENVVGYHIAQDPAPILVVQPREADAKKFSKVRLAPMIRDTPALRGKVREPKTKDSNNTILEKSYPGGRLILGGANSPANLAGDPIRIVLMDEVDRFPASSGTEGSPIELAEARTVSFSNRKIVLTSTPTEEETSQIAKAYADSDQRRYFVDCPHCRESQTLVWGQVRWEKDEDGNHLTDTAQYFCEHCGAGWTEAERHQAVRDGRWHATKESKGTAGFHLNALYSPWANFSLANLADKFVKAKTRPLLLRTFTNTVLAETWAEKYEAVDTGSLESRAEAYPRRDGMQLVPAAGSIALTAGVDVQKDRIEATAVGWGRSTGSEECFVLAHIVLPGSPGVPDVWAHLWEWMSQPFPSENGADLFIRATCIDTGGMFTQASYDFTRPPTPLHRGRWLAEFLLRDQGTGRRHGRHLAAATFADKTIEAAALPDQG